jgi:hypothetical protein
MRLALYICLTGLALGIERVEGDARFVPFARSREDAQQHYVQGETQDRSLQPIYQAGSPRRGDEDRSFCRSKNFLGR